MTPPNPVAFVQAHRDDHISARAVHIIGGDSLTEEVIQGEVYLNDAQENPGRAFRIGVVYGAMRSTGISLDTIMRILGDTDG